MKKYLLLTVVFLTACSTSQESPDSEIGISTYEECRTAGGVVRYHEPHECEIHGEIFYDDTPLAKFVDYGPTDGYYASPVGGGPYPAVILIHEWWGLNKNIWAFARKLAKEGYVVLAVDLYEGESTDDPERARELATAVRENMDGAFANLQAAVDWLSLQYNVEDDRLASLGWCFGGGWSYQMAKNDLGVDASVIYYGQFNPDDDLEIMRANIMGHFGEEDESIPVDDVKAFRANLKTHSGDHQIFIYENEGHGFARELESDSSKKAWERTLEFLSEQL